MDEKYDENVHFRMKLDADEDIEEPHMPTQVDELRIEKLNHRITFIGILIPVLIVIILTVAYLDIKRRVMRTEDTGAVTAKNLTEDLDSRFSTLSLKQAHIEEALDKFQDQTNQSIAKAQVNLKKLDESLKQYRNATVTPKELTAASKKLDQGVANVANATEELKVQIDALAQALPARIGQIEQEMTSMGQRMVELNEAMAKLENEKIDKAAMELAIKLEILKVKQQYDAQLEDIQNQLKSMGQKIAKQAQSAKQQPPSSTKSQPRKSTTSRSNDELEEQNIR